MGIPHLSHFLRPYATALDVPSSPVLSRQNDIAHEPNVNTALTDRKHQNGIVDGPALAYHAYHEALARRRNARNAMDAIPSYPEINSAAVTCLEVLEQHGVRIAMIFFDGLLPTSKREIRLGRLNSHLQQMEAFRSQHTAVIDLGADNSSALSKPFSFHHIPAKSTCLPAIPFLVPSVIEALSQSGFAERTRVVPAEADSYCTSYVKKHGGTILTSDSDLLAYDLGEQGSVSMLRDVELVETDDECTLKILQYKNNSIAQRLGLESLQSLAYAVLVGHHRGFFPCLSYAKRMELTATEGYSEFLMQYSIPDIYKPTDSRVNAVLLRLDPRISEWVHQVLFRKDVCESRQPETFELYLPFLIEDTKRASAWNVGQDFRSAACYILTSSICKVPMQTAEYARRGNRITSTLTDAHTPQLLNQYLNNWCSTWKHLSDHCKVKAVAWRMFALCTFCQSHSLADRKALTRPNLYALLSGRIVGPDWDFVHLSAQLQAALYSLRMLKQTLMLWRAMRTSASDEKQCYWHAVIQWYGILQDLPSIADLFASTAEVDEEQLDKIVDMILSMMDVDEEVLPLESISSSKSNRKKRKREKVKGVANAKAQNRSTPFSQSSNMYNLLSTTDA